MNRVAELIPGFERFLIVLASNAYFHVWMKKVYLGRVLKYSIRYLLRWNQNFFSGNKTGHETDDKPNERKKFEFLNARNSLCFRGSWSLLDSVFTVNTILTVIYNVFDSWMMARICLKFQKCIACNLQKRKVEISWWTWIYSLLVKKYPENASGHA